MLDPAEIQGHEDNVEGLIAHMRKYSDILRGGGIENAPDVPKPAADAPAVSGKAA